MKQKIKKEMKIKCKNCGRINAKHPYIALEIGRDKIGYCEELIKC